MQSILFDNDRKESELLRGGERDSQVHPFLGASAGFGASHAGSGRGIGDVQIMERGSLAVKESDTKSTINQKHDTNGNGSSSAP